MLSRFTLALADVEVVSYVILIDSSKNGSCK
jgi:hypothetical protein